MALLILSGHEQISFVTEGRKGTSMYNPGREASLCDAPSSTLQLYRPTSVRRIVNVNPHCHRLMANLKCVFFIDWQELSPRGEPL
jgi:hypothetical protein